MEANLPEAGSLREGKMIGFAAPNTTPAITL
ncbi:MAG: hypothetical protein DDT22_00385 [candidate division WS2 bacterium]|nr:hypothetical protein [Candidatus Lithacetigena glycinireducens]